MSGAGGLVKTIILLTYSLGAPATRGRVVNESEWELIVERRAAKNTINYVGVRSRRPAKERFAQNTAQERRQLRQRQFAGDATWPVIIYRGIFLRFIASSLSVLVLAERELDIGSGGLLCWG